MVRCLICGDTLKRSGVSHKKGAKCGASIALPYASASAMCLPTYQNPADRRRADKLLVSDVGQDVPVPPNAARRDYA
ncbi:MAG: hypothetical protein F4202_05865 [Cenarchaeum sp. SB0677_bin_16]|nr:hypothetical protein [Cenarchaeum sp. SB0677_bin_16]